MSSRPSSADALADAPTHHWEELAQRLDDFLAAWEKVESPGGTPPAIKNYLPTEPPSLRRLVLVELIKTDMEKRVKVEAAEAAAAEAAAAQRSRGVSALTVAAVDSSSATAVAALAESTRRSA